MWTVLGHFVRSGSASASARARRTRAEDECSGVVAVAHRRLQFPRAPTVACITAAMCVWLASVAASARAEVEYVPPETPLSLKGETLVPAEGAGGTAAGVVIGAAVVYPIITKYLRAKKLAERPIVPELSKVCNPLQCPGEPETTVVEKAAEEVMADHPNLTQSVVADIPYLEQALHESENADNYQYGWPYEEDFDQLLKNLDQISTGKADLDAAMHDITGDVKLNVQDLVEQQFGFSPKGLPPLPDLPPPPNFVRNSATEPPNALSETLTKMQGDNVEEAQNNGPFAQVMNTIEEDGTGVPNLVNVDANAAQDLQYVAQSPDTVDLEAEFKDVIGVTTCPLAATRSAARRSAATCPKYPIEVSPSGAISTTVKDLQSVSREADQQTTAVTQKTVADVKGEVASPQTVPPAKVESDAQATLGTGLASDAVASELPEEVLADAQPGNGVSAAATAAEGSVERIASQAAEETAQASAEGALDGAEVAVEAGETAFSTVDPLMLIQLATQLPQIITQIVQLIKGEPSFEQQVLSALGSIKEQLSALSRQVQEGFNYVDETLHGVDSKIEQDTQLLEHVAANGSQLQSELAEITGKLDQIQATLYRIAESAREETLNTALNTYLGYPRLGEELPLVEFAKARATFFTWGAESSLNAVSEHKGGSRAPNQVAAELQGTEGANALNENLDYLAAFANHAGWLDELPQLSENVPNPEVWATASNAFSQLLLENTGHLTTGLLASISELESVGQALQPFIQEITEKGHRYAAMEVDGVKIDTGSSILNHALANYLNSAVAPGAAPGTEPSLVNRVKAQEDATLATQQPAATAESYNHCSPCRLGVAPTAETGNTGEALIDPWAGPYQTPSGQPLTQFAAASDPAQEHSGGVSALAEMNVCREPVKNSNPGEFNVESNLPAWENDEGDIEAGGLLGLNGSNADPLSGVFANAWHLGDGRLFACYAAEYSQVGLKTQVSYFWQSFGYHRRYPYKYPVLRITLNRAVSFPRGVARSDCTQNPVEWMRQIWSSHEFCSPYLTNDPNLETQYQRVTAYVLEKLEQEGKEVEEEGKQHASWEAGGATLNNAECKAHIQGLGEECGVEIAPHELFFPEEFEHELQAIAPEVAPGLTQLRHLVIRHLAEPNASESLSEDAPANVQAAAVRVNGARALLDDYIELGMPNAMTDDPTLRDFVIGVGDNLEYDEKAGNHLLDNSPGAPSLYSVFTRELGEIEAHNRPAIFWPLGFPREHCEEECPVQVGLEAQANPVSEQPEERNREADGVVSWAFKRGVELLARRIHADLAKEATPAIAREPLVEAAAAQLALTRDVLSIAPLNTKAPEVTGSPLVGNTLNCSPGSWEARPSPKFTYRWLRDGVSVGDGPGHLVTLADVGQELACEVTASNGQGEASAKSSATIVTATPNLTIEDRQKVRSSAAAFTNGELTVSDGQTVEYRITVKNAGNVPLKLKNFTDADCVNLAGGAEELAVEGSTEFTCERVIHAGRIINEASVEAEPPAGEGLPFTGTSNTVVAVGPPAPVLTVGATNLAPRTATLEGIVNPSGIAVTSCWFEYTNLKTKARVMAPCTKTPAAGTTPVQVFAAISKLQPATEYSFRLCTKNARGHECGEAVMFETIAPLPPRAETLPATKMTTTAATLNGAVTPGLEPVTECRFEYGTTAKYGRSTSCAGGVVGSIGYVPVAAKALVTGLKAGSTIHYRLTAKNLSGSAIGVDQQFMVP